MASSCVATGDRALFGGLGADEQGSLTAAHIAAALDPPGPARETALWADAHRARVAAVGSCVHLRAIIEFSNYCRQDCLYCGLRRSNGRVARYRMDPDEIIRAALAACRVHKFGAFVLQSGEDPGYPPDGLARAVSGIKASTGAAVTLSVGEAPDRHYRLWREAGADRFLLKFETGDPGLFARLKPTTTLAARLGRLKALRDMGYQVGSGIILGLPGQDRASVARDLLLCREEDYEMVSIGPFIPHPDTPLRAGATGGDSSAAGGGTAHERGHARWPARTPDVRATLNTVAVARLLVPMAHMPATTALGVVGRQDNAWRGLAAAYLATMGELSGSYGQGACSAPPHGPGREDTDCFGDARFLALLAGANVLMLDVTPWQYRSLYEIYPGKPGADGDEIAEAVDAARREINRLGMSICPGRGDSPKARWGQGIRKEDIRKGECSDVARQS